MVRFLSGRQSHAAVASHDCCGDGRGIAARPSALPASTTAAYVLAVASPAEGTVGGVRVGAIVGTCEAMCPAPERERRARLSDIQVGFCAGLHTYMLASQLVSTYLKRREDRRGRKAR